MKKWLLMGRRFLGAVMLGAILSIYLLQNTQRTRNYFARFIQEVFATQLKSNFSGTVRSINLFTLTVVFQDVTVKSVDAHDDWFWKADIFKISGSLWRLMSHHLMDLHMNLEQLYTYSAMNAGSLALTSHLNDIFLCYGDNLPFDLKNLSIKDGLLRVKHSNGYTADISWNNDFERDAGKDRARFFLKNLKVYSEA
ncbi:MAG: hypothetical protein WD068_03030, partial [Candidatus Babeliales bacterium]